MTTFIPPIDPAVVPKDSDPFPDEYYQNPIELIEAEWDAQDLERAAREAYESQRRTDEHIFACQNIHAAAQRSLMERIRRDVHFRP